MRRARITLIAILLTLTACVAARGQHSLGRYDGNCGCNACSPCGTGCGPLLPSLTQSVHNALGSLFCCPALDARHAIYRAALHRNDFGKCNKYLPFYSCRNKCCCGGVATGCQQCGTQHVQGGEVIEMQEVPDGMMIESDEMSPTPATEPTPAVEPSAPAAETPTARAKEARRRVNAPRPNSGHAKSAASNAVRNRVAVRMDDEPAPRVPAGVAKPRAKQTEPAVQPVSLFEALQVKEPANPLR